MKKILLLVLCMTMLIFSGCALPTINLSGYDTYPEDDLQTFIDLLASGKYDESNAYLYNYSSLGFEKFEEGSIYSSLLDNLNASRSFYVLGSSSIKGHDATMLIEFTTLDFRKLEETLSTASLEAVNDFQ